MTSFYVPDYNDLPNGPGVDLDKCAWGIFDKDGTIDELGTLNLLTPERVLAAAKDEIRCGTVVPLNLNLETFAYPSFGRRGLERKLIDLYPLGFVGYDEEITFNPQVGSHWNSFLHLAHQSTGLYYNGLKHSDFSDRTDVRNGIDHAACKGIAGRGVLLDWYSWAVNNERSFQANDRIEILPSELDTLATAQGVKWKEGDLLFVRTGFIKWYKESSDEERRCGTAEATNFIGIRADKESFKWHWNHHLAAVVADNMTYEAWPPSNPLLHEHLLAMTGTIIGKLWDLEELAETCKELQRWTFFISSSPSNITDGINSPSNAMAIF